MLQKRRFAATANFPAHYYIRSNIYFSPTFLILQGKFDSPNMIRRFFPFILFFLPLAVLAQNPAQFTGELTNANVEEVSVIQDDLFIAREPTQFNELRSSSFAFELNLAHPQPVTFLAAKKKVTVFLAPGDRLELKMNLDENGAERLRFSGPAAPQNTFLHKFLEEFGPHFDKEIMEARILATPVDVLELDLYSQRQKQNKALDAAFQDSDFPQAFRAYLRNEVAYAYDRWLLAYPIVRAEASAKILEVKHLPRIIQQGIDAKNLVKEAALPSQVYRDYVWYYMTYFTSEKNGFKKFKDYNNSLNQKAEYAGSHLKGEVLTWYLSKLLADNCNKIAPGTVERMRSAIKKGGNATPYLKAVAGRCEEMNAGKIASAEVVKKGKRKKLKHKKRTKMTKKGTEKYDFRMVDLDGKAMHLSDFAGKVVYIDFWASWCGPCRGQMPFSKKLHHKLKEELSKKEEKEIVFLYISIDQDEKSWRKGIEAMQIEGTHGFSNARWPDGAGNFFQIPGIPRYMIMNKDGEIVNKNAARPSMAGIYTELLDLIR